EPTLYDLEPLTAALVEAGFRTHLETSGAHPLTGRWNWVCLSPKKFKPPREDAYALADELKVVVYHPSDLSWAEEHASRCRPQTLLYLQPEWSRHDQSAKLIVEYVKEHPRWRLSLQTHKFVGIP
ncbi:MAG: 7-carboxy-7-deazaguanine synthase QueE, partial [Bacteroidia bacterium]|nr:7-carboxy-7-deazaguanine synthase QueE [Bacteroidia bacterium]